MTTSHVESETVINLHQHGVNTSGVIASQEKFDLMRVYLVAGKSLAPHKVNGPITVFCLVGTATFSIGEKAQSMTEGDWLHLEAGVTHSVDAISDCVLIVTRIK